MLVDDVPPALLAWYDANARILPWRSPPGAPPPEPYRVWLSEVMLQQTTTAAVAPYFARFIERWPDVAALAAADDADVMREWAGLGYYARARNLLAGARAVVATHDGRFPSTEAALRTLPGVGAYTAAAIAAIAFDRRAVVVDGNVERVVARLFAVGVALPAARGDLYRLAAGLTPDRRPGDHAQAMMDLGATVCIPRTPRCAVCPLSAACAGRAGGDPARYPLKAAKKLRPIRHGTAFWIEHDGEVLLVRRPASGLLGGMLALPTGPWEDAAGTLVAPVAGAVRLLPQVVRHVFTHFELRLSVAVVEPPRRPVIDGAWYPAGTVLAAGLPTLFARVATLVLRAQADDGCCPRLALETSR
ncbi:MAG: A/G-specific adenine glycosylase [Janthinobacterium lividum]